MVEFLTPLGALVGLAAVVPLVAVRMRERRHRRVRSSLALADPSARSRRPVAVAFVAVVALLSLAASQPALRRDDPVLARTDAQAYVLVDVSRSMLAAAAPGADSRFDRAVRLGLAFGRSLTDVPVGVASISDRPLPHLFPTADRDAFAAVLTRAVGVDRPPPSDSEGGHATKLGSIAAIGQDNYFSAASARRLVLLLTDGESLPLDAGALSRRLRRDGVDLVIVRFRSPSERVYATDGVPDPGYRPDTSSDGMLAALAASTVGGRVFGEDEADAALAAARRALGRGPVVEAVPRERTEPLAGWVALCAGVPLGFLLAWRPRVCGSVPTRVATTGSARREPSRPGFARSLRAR